MMPLFYDPTFLMLIPAVLLALWAQFKVKSTFAKFEKVQAGRGLTGAEVAKQLLGDAGLGNVQIEEVQGKLSDHYDPRTRVLRLSPPISRGRSVAALGVAAHEVGHAIQHQKLYSPFQVRQAIVPAANLGSTLAFPLFIFGMLFSSPKLMDIGILFFSAAVVFQLVTLPVEFNASSRAMVLLESRGYLVGAEVGQAKKVLSAAALTYVAATAMAVLQLVRLLILRQSRD
jgi:Zn-dependent membrane protease YugP